MQSVSILEPEKMTVVFQMNTKTFLKGNSVLRIVIEKKQRQLLDIRTFVKLVLKWGRATLYQYYNSAANRE